MRRWRLMQISFRQALTRSDRTSAASCDARMVRSPALRPVRQINPPHGELIEG
jgi:hypothetical protein